MVNRIRRINPNKIVDNSTELQSLIKMLSLLKGLTLDETLKEQIDSLLFEMNNEQRFQIKMGNKW